MQAVAPPPEVAFFQSGLGGSVTIVVSIAAFAAWLFWAARPGHSDRLRLVAGAIAMALANGLITLIAVRAGWWSGPFFTIPLGVQLALNLPAFAAGGALWLAAYRWLLGHTRHGFAIFTLVALAFIPIVVIVDGVNIGREQFTVGNGYTVWWDALAGQIVLWTPMVVYETLRRRGARSTSSPQQMAV